MEHVNMNFLTLVSRPLKGKFTVMCKKGYYLLTMKMELLQKCNFQNDTIPKRAHTYTH